MNLQEFIRDLADVEGKDALQKYVKDFWEQASNEDRAAVIQGIECLSGHLRKVVKSFWELCGVAYANGWITVDGKSYAISQEIAPDDGRGRALYQLVSPEKGKRPDQVQAAEQYYAARDNQVNVIKNDMQYKVRGE